MIFVYSSRINNLVQKAIIGLHSISYKRKIIKSHFFSSEDVFTGETPDEQSFIDFNKVFWVMFKVSKL